MLELPFKTWKLVKSNNNSVRHSATYYILLNLNLVKIRNHNLTVCEKSISTEPWSNAIHVIVWKFENAELYFVDFMIALDIVKNNAIHLVFFFFFFIISLFFYNLFFSLQKWRNAMSRKRKINSLSHPITKYMKSFIHQSRSMYKLNVHKNLLMCTAIKSNHLYCILKAMSSYISNRFPRLR